MATIKKKLPIVLIHGMWGCGEQFGNWIKYFEVLGYEVIAPTLPGHEIGGNVDGLSIYDYAKFIETVLSSAGPCYILGHSMGGLIAQLVGNHKNVRKIVLVTSAAPKGIRSVTWDIRWRMVKSFMRYIIPLLTKKGYSIKDDDARALMMNRLTSAFNPQDIFPSEESGLATRQLSFGEIEIREPFYYPSLVISGSGDMMTPSDIQAEIAAKYQSELHQFDCGHLPMMEGCWRIVAETIKVWLEK